MTRRRSPGGAQRRGVTPWSAGFLRWPCRVPVSRRAASCHEVAKSPTEQKQPIGFEASYDGGPSRTRTSSRWIKNADQPSASTVHREVSRDEQYPIATDQTGDTASEPLPARA